MIEKVILNPNPDLSPAVVKWDDEKGDFVIEIPHGIILCELVGLVEEIKRITQWED